MKKITKIAVISCCLLLVAGLAYGLDFPNTTGPKSESEAFPYRNQDPRLGVIVNEGATHLNLYIYDEADRLIEQTYFSGANNWLTINGRTIPRYWIRRLEAGRYWVEIYPFYYQTDIVAPLFGQPGRYRVDLPKQVAWIYVNRNPTDYYYADDYFPGRHFGWILRLNGGYIPDTAHGLPGIKVNVWGDFGRR